LDFLFQVKPEGYPVEKVQSEFLCRAVDQVENEETIEMKSLKLPSDLVEGSARAWVSVTGDILAPALEYLKGTGKVEPKLEDQVKNRSIQALIQILL